MSFWIIEILSHVTHHHKQLTASRTRRHSRRPAAARSTSSPPPETRRWVAEPARHVTKQSWCRIWSKPCERALRSYRRRGWARSPQCGGSHRFAHWWSTTMTMMSTIKIKCSFENEDVMMVISQNWRYDKPGLLDTVFQLTIRTRKDGGGKNRFSVVGCKII